MRPEPPPEVRFDKYSMPVTESGCWIWMGSLDGHGYGVMKIGGRRVSVHRYSWQKVNGPISGGLHVLHRCDVPCCVNPDHLFVGSHHDNMMDRLRKGRVPEGQAHPCAKATPEIVRTIRSSSESSYRLAARFGMSASSIRKIRDGRTWRSVPLASEQSGRAS